MYVYKMRFRAITVMPRYALRLLRRYIIISFKLVNLSGTGYLRVYKIHVIFGHIYIIYLMLYKNVIYSRHRWLNYLAFDGTHICMYVQWFTQYGLKRTQSSFFLIYFCSETYAGSKLNTVIVIAYLSQNIHYRTNL